MKEIQKALVALDLSAMDQSILRYTHFVSGILGLKKIYFVHIIPNLLIPADVDLAFHQMFSVDFPIDEKVQETLQAHVEEVFGPSSNGIEMAIEVIEGQPYHKLIHWSKVKSVDLLITGMKTKSEGSGITSRRVAHNARCNVLFVPEQPRTVLKKIMVPIDFSDNSARALQMALRFKQHLPETEIQAVHLIHMLSTVYYTGLDQNPSYRKTLLDAAEKSWKAMVEKHQLPAAEIRKVYIEDAYGNVSRHLTEYVAAEEADLVLMGAQGHTALQNLIYGSVTERFVQRCRKQPILVVR